MTMTYDDQIAAIQSRLDTLDSEVLTWLRDIATRLATLNKVISQQQLHNNEVDHNLTMLLAVDTGQAKVINATKADVTSLKEDMADVKMQLAEMDLKMAKMGGMLEQVLSLLKKPE